MRQEISKIQDLASLNADAYSIFIDIDVPLVGVVFPESLSTLIFGESFNQSLVGVKFPESLVEIIFGKYFNQSLVDVELPPSLVELTFGRHYKHSLDNVNLSPETTVYYTYFETATNEFSLFPPDFGDSFKLIDINFDYGIVLMKYYKKNKPSLSSDSIDTSESVSIDKVEIETIGLETLTVKRR